MKEEDTSLIIKKLDPAKAHGCDKDDQNLWWFINCPFNNNIFKQSLKEGDFPEIWKNACVVVVHKKR